MRVSVSFTPAELESREVGNSTAVVIDCLRASTSMVAALRSGAVAIHPLLTIEDARSAADGMRGAVLAGEREGLPIEGFHLGNSPSEFTPEAVGGRIVIMTTTNGTRALIAVAGAHTVYVGSFVNCRVTADAAGRSGRDVLLAAAGREGRLSIEDTLCAGAMCERLVSQYSARLDDAAQCARMAWQQARPRLMDAVLQGEGAHGVIALGFAADIDFALAVDSIDLVASVTLEPMRVVADGNPH